MELAFMHLQPCGVGHWAKTFQVAKGNNDRVELAKPWQLLKGPQWAEQQQPIQPQLQPELIQQPQREQLQQPIPQPQPVQEDQQPTHQPLQ